LTKRHAVADLSRLHDIHRQSYRGVSQIHRHFGASQHLASSPTQIAHKNQRRRCRPSPFADIFMGRMAYKNHRPRATGTCRNLKLGLIPYQAEAADRSNQGGGRDPAAEQF
jgi:hypothetical protein